jgi:two-component system, cell cycle sensor histidine kinase and response regulator CckA
VPRTTENVPKTSAPPLRLLLADDDPNDLALCLRELKKSEIPFQVDIATKRDDFIRMLREHPVDIVVSDYRMKDWSGMDALALIKEIRPEVPLILVTGTLGDELAVQCIQQGVTGYVLKGQLARLPIALRRAREEKEFRAAERNAIEALRESEARYRGLVDNATYGICWVTIEGGLLFVNPALVQMLGYDSPADLVAIQNTNSLFCDESARLKLLEQYTNRRRVDAPVEWKRKDGKIITVRLNGRAARDPESTAECMELIVEDITDRVALEKQLVQSQKFEGIGQLAGGIAHDFNNMIGAIIGWSEIGMEETELDSRLHRHFEKVRHQADRAASLTKQLLAFARRQILEPRDIDLNRSVTETLSLLETVIGSNIEIKPHLAPDLALVRADPTQVEQVLMNLCINARDAMPAGGSLTIETFSVSLDDAYCALQPLAHPGCYAVLSVTDSGTGMDAATLDRIFEPFFTTKEFGKGTGLGLATVYGVVRQHGGFVQVYSELGTGSTFRAYLPVSAAAAATPDLPEDTRPACSGCETLLVAEDHDGLRQLAFETLSRLGYQVILAADGEQAINEFILHRNSIDLAVLDVIMPKLSGPEVYERICAEKAGVPVIFATGYSADIALLQKALQQGLPVIQKPYSPRNLARKVREALDHRSARLLTHD